MTEISQTRNTNKVAKFFKGIGHSVVGMFKSIGRFFVNLWKRIVGFFKEIWNIMRHGNFVTWMSFFVMGFGCFAYGQWLRGALYLVLEVGFILFMIFSGGNALVKFTDLGNVRQEPTYDPDTGLQDGYTVGDNSLLILLFGVVTILIILIVVAMYFKQLKNAFHNQELHELGLPIDGTRQDLKQMLNKNFHTTILALPTLGIAIFTVIPLVFMLLIAFTNYDKEHPPVALWDWVGLDNFFELFNFTGTSSMGATFLKLLGWTLVWAVFATITTYIGGMILALLINRRGVRCKKIFRAFFVVTIAVPQFVSLLIISKFLGTNDGLINSLINKWGLIGPKTAEKLIEWGIMNNSHNIMWFGHAHLARTVVIIVNMWVGVPYSMLITSGILMNIPEELYESARIDGAGPVKTFFKITLPYMLFVTGPHLITQFIGNINNFNVIFLLTGGGPTSPDLMPPAGKTDLLITWLYNLTVNGDYKNYKMGTVIGILIFIVCSVVSLIVYSRTSAVKNEEVFQ